MSERRLFIDNVQVLRGIAALMVVTVHSIDIALLLPGSAFTIPAPLENFGSAGVDLFFVISGFIIAHTAFGDVPRKPLDFARQRVWRVVPLYLLLSVPYLLTATHVDFGMLVATGLFWPASDLYLLSEPLMPIGWTLCFEMLFYAAATIILVRPGPALVALMLLAYAACWLLVGATELAAFRFLGNPLCLEFLLGVLIAKAAPRLSARLGLMALAVGVCWFVATMMLGLEGRGPYDPLVWTRLAIWGLPSALVVLGAVLMPPWGPASIMRPLLMVGAASYSLYLAHPLGLWMLDAALRAFGQGWNGMVVLGLGMAASIAIGVLVYRCLEQPLLAGRRAIRLQPAPG